MPNRIIKESICVSDKIATLTDFEFRLWVGLLTQVDDVGRGDARPAIIKGAVFPLRDKVTARDIADALRGLEKKGCITLYEVDGKSLFYFPNWASHQRVRDCKPKFPEPPDGSRKSAEICGEIPQNFATCENLPQLAANCGELPQPAKKCGYNPNPNPNTNPNTNNIYIEKNTPLSSLVLSSLSADAERAEGDIEQEWTAFREMRKKLKKPMTEYAEKLALKKLEELSGGNIEKKRKIINQSILRGWLGLFPLEEEKQAGTPPSFDIDDFFADAVKRGYDRAKNKKTEG